MFSSKRTTVHILLILGFGALSISTIIAYLNPAAGYELSLYSDTPIEFWIGSVAALIISVKIVFFPTSALFRASGVLLGGLTMTAIISLPIIRGYYYVGEGDALSHLGRTREFNSGVLLPLDSRYPAVHTHGSILGDIANIQLTDSLLLYISVFLISFFIFIPLTVRVITQDRWIAHIGIFSGFLLLPINHVSGHMQIHPTSQAVVFAPALIYIFIRVYRNSRWEMLILFIIVSSFYTLLHPQQAANYILFFTGFCVAAFLYSQNSKNKSIKILKTHISAFVFIIIFWLWAANLPAFESSLAGVLRSIFTLFAEDTAAESVSTRGVSLEQIGGGIEEIFVKMFAIALIYSIFAGLLMAIVVINSLNISRTQFLQNLFLSRVASQKRLYLFLTAAFISTFSLFFVYLTAGISDQYFRHYAFLMSIVTILGTISLARALKIFKSRCSETRRRSITIAVMMAFLMLTLPIVFASPYIYQSSSHVTEAQMDGFETTFKYENDELSYDFVRSPTSRYGIAINGHAYQDRSEYYRDGVRRGGLPDHFADQQLRSHYDEPVYLTITGADRIRDPVLYNGFRFSKDDFDYLDSEPGINNVYSNSEFDLYLVKPR